MVGFEAADRAMVESALEDFLPDTCTIKRRSSSQTKGDYVQAAQTTVYSNVRCRIQPITPLGTEKTRLKEFPAMIADRAEYLITLDNANVYKDNDILIDQNNKEYRLTAVRFDYASWRPVVRAVAIAVE